VGRAGDFLKHFFFAVALFVNQIRSFFQHSQNLHHARFAELHELTGLLTDRFDETSLLLCVSRFDNLLHVRPTKTRKELGNLLVVAAPTRGGKGLLATSQLLSWPHSIIVNDIKGELFPSPQSPCPVGSDYSRSMCFRLFGKRTPHWVTLPPDGSVRAGGFLRQMPDHGEQTAGSRGSDATCPKAVWEQARRRYSAGSCHAG
jgi:hypothetical protein